MRQTFVVFVFIVCAGSTFAQPGHPLQLRANESLREYEQRVTAYFAPLIAEKGEAALIADEGSEYSQYLKFMRLWEPRLGPTGDFNLFFQQDANRIRVSDGKRRAARHDISDVMANGIVRNATPWQELGPSRQPTADNYQAGIGPIEFVSFFPGEPSRMLTGSTAGGLFYSSDDGVTWRNGGTDTGIGRSGVMSAVFHPTNHQTWFASSSGNSGSANAERIGPTGGVFRTFDEGATWTRIASASTFGDWSVKIYKIAIHPTNGDRLWAATSNGLYATGNATASTPSWTTVTFKGEIVYDFELRPGNPDVRYAAVGSADAKSWRFMVTNDGTTWQPLANQPPTAAIAQGLTIEISPARPDRLVCVFVNTEYNNNLYRWWSELWTHENGVWTRLTDQAWQLMGGGHAFSVDRFEPNVVFLADGYGGRRYTIGATPQFRSFDKSTFHDDVECVVPHPVVRDEVWLCHHGGLAVSHDGGITYSDRSNGLGVAQTWRFAASPSDPHALSVGLYHTTTAGTDSPWQEPWIPAWKQLEDARGDGQLPLIDPVSSLLKWHSNQYGHWKRATDGKTFLWNFPPSPLWAVDARFDYVNPATQYRIGETFNGYQTINRSSDSGNTWVQIIDLESTFPKGKFEYGIVRLATPETSSGYLVVHLIERLLPKNPNDPKPWWTSHLFRTKIASDPNAAFVIASWEALPMPAQVWPADIELDPRDPNVVYLADSSSVNMGQDPYGKGMIYRIDYTNPSSVIDNVCAKPYCEDLSQNLPNASAGRDVLSLDRRAGGGMYFVCDYGAFYSNEVTRAIGSGWVQIGANLPNTTYGGVELNYVNNKLRVGSFGRGLWEHDLVATISGTKYEDVNGNGKRDDAEPGLPNWTITLTDTQGRVTRAITNAAGGYTFSAVPRGQFVLSEQQLVGWSPSAPATGRHTVTLSAGEQLLGVDFGNRAPAPASCVTNLPDMVAWWKFSHAFNGEAGEIAGRVNNNGRVVGSPQIVPGPVGNAYRFDGQSQYVTVPSESELQLGTSDFTIEAWVRTSATGVAPIIDKRGSALLGYALFLFDGRLGLQMADRIAASTCSSDNTVSACTNFIAPLGSVNVADGQWHHVAVTVARHATGGGKLYVDGVVVMTFDPTIRDRSLDNSAPLLIARRSDVSSTVYWEGDIDEPSIFRRVLSASEIQAIYKTRDFGKCFCEGPHCPIA